MLKRREHVSLEKIYTKIFNLNKSGKFKIFEKLSFENFCNLLIIALKPSH